MIAGSFVSLVALSHMLIGLIHAGLIHLQETPTFTLSGLNVATILSYAQAFAGVLVPIALPLIGLSIGVKVYRSLKGA